MPIPSSPEQWAAIEPNEGDQILALGWLLDGGGMNGGSSEALAAASRLLERERADAEHEAAIHAAAIRGARLALEASADDAHDKWAAHRSETTGFTHWKDVEAWLRARSQSVESIVKEGK